MQYAIVYKKLVKMTKGRSAGKYKYEQKHESFNGTWEELEEYLNKNSLILIGWDSV